MYQEVKNLMDCARAKAMMAESKGQFDKKEEEP